MSIEYIARIDIGREIPEEEVEQLCEWGRENEVEFMGSDRGWDFLWSKSIWSIADEKEMIIELDINEINEAFKKAVERYGNEAKIIFSLVIN